MANTSTIFIFLCMRYANDTNLYCFLENVLKVCLNDKANR